MADKNVLLHDATGNNLYPKTKAANIVDNIDASKIRGILSEEYGGTGVNSLTTLLAALGFNIGSNYIKLPNGKMFQWGNVGGYTSAKRDNITITLPQAFANTGYTVLISGYYNGSQPEAYETAGTAYRQSTTQFILHRFNTTSNYLNAMCWLAIGDY